MVKFSVLLPTRNRLDLLKYAIASVLSQDHENFEVIVSDNYSEEDIQGYINSLKDPRIKYYRTDSFVSVTDSWNNALDKSTGEWIIMLGDDDCLMKGYFSTISNILEQFPNPDFIYTHGFLFAYPKALPDYPEGLVQTASNAPFLMNQQHPFLLKKEQSFELAEQTFNFKCFFTYNMQFAIINRSFIEKLTKQGKFYFPPYPDYYSMTLMMLYGERIVACPYPLVGVGISKKSFEYYLFNNLELESIAFLNNSHEKTVPASLEKIIFPGTDFNTSWLLSLHKIKTNFEGCKLKINYRKYRLIQIIAYLQQIYHKNVEYINYKDDFRKRLSFLEKCLYGLPWHIFSYFTPRFQRGFQREFLGILSKLAKTHFPLPVQCFEERFENIQQFFEKINPFNFTFKTHD